MATSNRGKTNAIQQVANISLKGLDLEKVIAKPKEKSKKQRRGGLAAELKRAAKRHQTAKDNAEKRGVQVPQHLAVPPGHLFDATTTPQIQALSNHLANSATAIRQLSQEPYKRVGDFGAAIKRTMTPTELAAASAKAAEDRAAATASTASTALVVPQTIDQPATAPPPAPVGQVDAAVADAKQWLQTSTTDVLGGDAGMTDEDKLFRFAASGSTIASRLIQIRDEAQLLGRGEEIDALHEEVFHRIGSATSELTQHEASVKNGVFMITAVENMGIAFEEMKDDYKNQYLTFVQTRDAMQLLLGEVKQFQKLLSLLDGNDIKPIVDGLQADVETYLQELDQYGAQSAVIARATKKK